MTTKGWPLARPAPGLPGCPGVVAGGWGVAAACGVTGCPVMEGTTAFCVNSHALSDAATATNATTLILFIYCRAPLSTAMPRQGWPWTSVSQLSAQESTG